MFTPSARAAFHRLAARAHDRLDPWLGCPDAATHAARLQRAQERTDEAWSVSVDPDFNEEASAEECYAADEANTQAEDGNHSGAAKWHRVAAKAAHAA